MTDLENEVQHLKEQVKKLQVMLANTGQQVMQLQMHQHKQEIANIGTKTQDLQSMVPDAKGQARQSDFVTESDLGDMVMELQGQLTILDQRGIRRILNSRSKERLLPLPNADGEHHPKFPPTLEALQTLTDEELFEQWNHFEMLPNGETLDDLLETEASDAAKRSNDKMMLEIYESFVQYIGVDPEELPRKAAPKAAKAAEPEKEAALKKEAELKAEAALKTEAEPATADAK